MPVITKEFALNMKGDDEIRDITKNVVRDIATTQKQSATKVLKQLH